MQYYEKVYCFGASALNYGEGPALNDEEHWNWVKGRTPERAYIARISPCRSAAAPLLALSPLPPKKKPS